MNSPDYAWKECLKALQLQISKDDFRRYIEPIVFECKHHTIFLWVSNQLSLNQIRVYFLPHIHQQLKGNLSFSPQVFLKIGRKKGKTSDNLDSSVGLDPLLHFDRFVLGPCNTLAQFSALQTAKHAGDRYNPLIICGDVGLGKTHLLHAIGHHILSLHPYRKLMLISAEQFLTEMVVALKAKKSERFIGQYNQCDVLLMDDVHFFTKKKKTQEEFLQLLKLFLSRQRQVVLTSTVHPKYIDEMELSLRSRLSSGYIVALHPLDPETKLQIIHKKIAEMKVKLKPHFVKTIFKNTEANVRDIEGVINKIAMRANMDGEVTLSSMREVLTDGSMKDRIKIELISGIVSRFYDITVSDLLSQKRTHRLSYIRQMAMALTRKLTGHSLAEIAIYFGRKDHTVVIKATKRIEGLKQVDPVVLEGYESIRARILREGYDKITIKKKRSR